MFNGHCWDPSSANWSLASDQCQKVTYVRLRSVEMLQDEQNPLELAPNSWFLSRKPLKNAGQTFRHWPIEIVGQNIQIPSGKLT
jgi:hypothetical protein